MTPVVAFFNSQVGIGATSLVYHLAWMYADTGHRVLLVDLDPQARLTTMLVDEDRLKELWSHSSGVTTFSAFHPEIEWVGGPEQLTEPIAANLQLLAGDFMTAALEEKLAALWSRALDGQDEAFRALAAMNRGIQTAAEQAAADVVLVELGANLSALNRVALTACHHVVVPVAPSLSAMQGVRVVGQTLHRWRSDWIERLPKPLRRELGLIAEPMAGAGYIVLQPAARLDSAARVENWMAAIPRAYAFAFDIDADAASPSEDPRCLGILRRFPGLIAMAEEARKPIFHLRPADGAMGAHATAVLNARKDFREIADRLAAATWKPVA